MKELTVTSRAEKKLAETRIKMYIYARTYPFFHREQAERLPWVTLFLHFGICRGDGKDLQLINLKKK